MGGCLSWIQTTLNKNRDKTQFIQQQRAYAWNTLDEKTMKLTADLEKSLDTILNTSFLNIVCQLSLSLVFGIYVGVMRSVFQLLNDVIHYNWIGIIEDDKHSFYAVWIHWTLGATISSGAAVYFIKRWYPGCTGGGYDISKLSMALCTPVLRVFIVNLDLIIYCHMISFRANC